MPLRLHLVTAIWLLLAALAPAMAQEGSAAAPLVRQLPQSRSEVLLSYAPVVKKVSPAVVNIYAARMVAVRSPLFDSPFVRRFLGQDFSFGIPRERLERSLGSGVIVRAEGIVVTNNHVIGKADVIKVVLADRREFDAEVVLADPRTDLAVLRLKAGDETFPEAPLAEKDDAEVGDIVLAIGNPFGIGQTVTAGIVSATARTQIGINDYGFFLQTDAAVNPGNSGGPLVALTGKIIGINTAIYTRTGDTSGIGFAIPASMVRTVLRAALDEGEIVRPWLGLSGQPVTADLAEALGLDRPGGVLVGDLYPDGPAARAGLRTGDVILKVDGEDVPDDRALRFRVATHPPGEGVTLTVLRDGDRIEIPVEPTPLPEIPERRITRLTGPNPFQGVTIGNLSPRFADELGLDPMRTGVIVLEVDPRSPAGRVGYVRPGDILVNVQNRRVESVADVVIVAKEPWETWLYRVRRGDQLFDCAVFRNGAVECRRAR